MLETDASNRVRRLKELFAEAATEASAAMSKWTSGLIKLEIDEVREVPLEEASVQFDLGMDLLTMVVLTMDNDAGGTIILTFDDQNGRELAASLLSRSIPDSPEWTELEKSALCETGNILGCAYVNAINRAIKQQLVPSPPYFLQDFGISVLQQSLMAQAADCDNVLICRTHFTREGKELDWNVFFVPNQEMKEALNQAFQA